MRCEQEILRLVLDFARADNRIRVVLMNGSRANPNAPKDPFQDYDIACLVTDVEPYRRNLDILRRFGDILIHQEPDDMGDPAPERAEGYAYLMQYVDGTRIDLSFTPIRNLRASLEDTQTLVLLDKDDLVGPIPPPSDRGYLPKPPTAKTFADCCNEFWWLNPYVAKGLWRDELPYARHMLDTLMRGELMKMLVWYVGTNTGFGVATGKLGKYLRRSLDTGLWDLFLRTYAAGSVEGTWNALYAMGELFRSVATSVAGHFRFEYPAADDRGASEYIRRIRAMPSDATTIPPPGAGRAPQGV